MNDIVKVLVTWLQWEFGDERRLDTSSIPYYAVLPRSWEAMIPDLAERLGVRQAIIMLVMSQLYWRQGKDLSPLEVYVIVTDAIEEFKKC